MPHVSPPLRPLVSTRGVLASMISSVLFAGLYFVTPYLHPASAEAIWAIRNIVAVPFVILVILSMRQWYLITDIARRIKRQPIFALGIITSGFLVAAQLWVFGYAPLNGRGLQVALGYFLLPLMLVVVGRLLYKDRLVWWQWGAAGVAALGVAYELIRVGSISWETLLVALGYPFYFVLRRAMGTNNLAGMAWEFAAMTPFALFFLVREVAPGKIFTENPTLMWLGPVFGLMSALAVVLYLVALRLLIMSLFGLLAYLEPALLVVASILNGEVIPKDEWLTYGAIWAAVLILMTGGAFQVVAAAKRRRPT